MDESGRVSGDDARVQWLPGNEIGVQVERLTDEPVIAGEPFPVRLTFVDEQARAPDVEDTVIVGDACSSWATLVLFKGSADHNRPVSTGWGLRRGPHCRQRWFPRPFRPLRCRPGPVARRGRELPETAHGRRGVTALVEPVDAYGNTADGLV